MTQTRQYNPVHFGHHAASQRDEAERWQDRAACRNHEYPDLWFPTSRDPKNPEVALAKEFCSTCPVADLCVEEGLELGSRDGQIRGGVQFSKGKSRSRIQQQRALFIQRVRGAS